MNLKLSNRLQAVADFVPQGAIVADIGTDHGYLSVWLTINDIASHVIATDRAKGPLKAAEQFVNQLSLTQRIETRLGDGLKALQPNEADTICIAGMGGMTIMDILEQSPDVLATTKRLVLQPQRGAAKVRRWLIAHNFRITAENLATDEGLYYVIIVAEPGRQELTPAEISFGPEILKNGHPLFAPYLKLKTAELSRLREAAATGQGPEAQKRKDQLDRELAQIAELLNKIEN